MSATEAPSWTRHEDPRGFAVSLPPDWQMLVDPRADVALAGLHPEVDPWGFRTNVLVTLDDLDRGMTVQAWQAGADKLLPTVMVDYLLLDRQDVHVGPRAGVRRLAHHASDGHSLTMEQWAVIDGRRGFTLTATVSTLAYPRLADLLAQLAATFGAGGPVRSHGRNP